MTLAVLLGTFIVSLLCCYVYAYARVTAAGFEQSRLLRDMQKAKQEEEALKAEVSRLSLPGAVGQRAQSLGMAPAPSGAALVLAANRPVESLVVAQRGR